MASSQLERKLAVTFIEAGWGDSILVEACDGKSPSRFALVDCNDSTDSPSARCFVQRFVERTGRTPCAFPFFDFVVATHAHADHIRGLRKMLSNFGTTCLYSSRFNAGTSTAMAKLLQWAATTTAVSGQPVCTLHQYVHTSMPLSPLGPVDVSVLWPPGHAPWPKPDENQNSVVLALTLDDIRFVLTGDCEVENWDTTQNDHVVLPPKVRMVQIPHHGARNGVIAANGATPLLDEIANRNKSVPSPEIEMGVSCHSHPHGHPHSDVITELDSKNIACRRTDSEYHVTFSTDGKTYDVQWSRWR